MSKVAPAEVKPGDKLAYQGIEVTVLRDPEDSSDPWGQPMIRFWASRADTEAEGWMVYGPRATIELENR